MLLSSLLKKIQVPFPGGHDIEVTGMTSDSRQVKPGYIFFAIPGVTLNGADFIPSAIENGAAAVIAEDNMDVAVPLIYVQNARQSYARAAGVFYPSDNLKKVAVTGTNGKTSTVFFVQQLLNKMGTSAASMGTIGIQSPVWTQSEGKWTTPDPLPLHQTLHEMQNKGIKAVAMEASSQGLDQSRLEGVRFQGAAFTNLTQDHLDYHQNMDAYLTAKKRLFLNHMPAGSLAVLNADIPEFADLEKECRHAKLNIFSYGYKGTDLKIISQKPTQDGQHVVLEALGKRHTLDLPILGDFQLMNILAAVGLCVSLGADLEKTLSHLSGLHAPSGRLEKIGATQNGAQIYLDYAHTPDALSRVLLSLRPHTPGRLVCVFGCGGNRDAGKRPLMGQIADQLADGVYLTDDNPRDEDPLLILDQIKKTCPKGQVVPDRGAAIRTAIRDLKAGDFLVIAGKGHEPYQIIKGVSYAFSDRQEVLRALMDEKNMPPLWLADDLSRALSASVDGKIACHGASMDTRTLHVGDMFIALKGEKIDGHAYVRCAVESGAAACLVDHLVEGVPHDKQIVVPDVLAGLEALGRYARARSNAVFIGVTGSSGKTTTKEMLRQCLGAQGNTYAARESYNNNMGVPFTLMCLPHGTEYAILEMGMNHTGELSLLSDIVRPDVTLIVNVGAAHLGQFKDESEIAAAKAEIFDHQNPAGSAVLNKDNPFYQFLADKATARGIKHLISFGQNPAADFVLESAQVAGDKMYVNVSWHGEKLSYALNFIGTHFAMNSLAVLAVTDAVGASVAHSVQILPSCFPVAGRGLHQKIILPSGAEIVLIDDAFNANPSSVRASIQTLGYHTGRKIAVLGDMLELGAGAEALHLGLKNDLLENKIDRVYTMGPLMGMLFDTLPEQMQAQKSNDLKDLGKILLEELKEGDIVLVKSSKGTKLSLVVKALKGEK
ncbi:MAG: UDP-N-acetylmuramoyl-L-alanyl-D-glutamate--2,6-diaminopimelate ligase [Lactobacillales bacterium]|jgi:UDP-N-acetylmuramyl-tripeptide synthetase/UDP-N-acetylmuramoyl-tripeptide--D-alanyl-D-alanine ligase|nr:UDP-N-acetylmuramoyl-L-alanyl-D-glutamate--2,6-diaminopimelate ligase [Lactobacillales bacterium]